MLYLIALLPGLFLVLLLLGVSCLAALGARLIDAIIKTVSTLISKDA